MRDAPQPPAPSRPAFARWLFRVAFVALGLLIAAMLISQSETFPECVHSHKNDKTYQSLRERTGVLGGAIKRFGARARLSYVCTWQFTDKNNGALIALATIMLSAFTFTLWRATDRLWQSAHRQTAHFEDTAERQLRAYISVARGDIVRTEGRFGARIVFKNYGQTPAYDVRLWMAVQIRAVDREDEFPPPSDNAEGSKGIIGPGSDWITTQFSCPFTSDELGLLKECKAAIYVWGQVIYRDAFNKTRWTPFRLNGFVPEGALGPCEDGNEAT